jgi:hypothetical protein
MRAADIEMLTAISTDTTEASVEVAPFTAQSQGVISWHTFATYLRLRGINMPKIRPTGNNRRMLTIPRTSLALALKLFS